MDRWWCTARSTGEHQLRYAAGLAHASSHHHRSKIHPPPTYCIFPLYVSSHCRQLKLTCNGCIYWASLQQCVTSIAARYAAVLRMRTFATTGCSAAPPQSLRRRSSGGEQQQQQLKTAGQHNFRDFSSLAEQKHQKTVFSGEGE